MPMSICVSLALLSIFGVAAANPQTHSTSSSSLPSLPNCSSLPSTMIECTWDCGCRLGSVTEVTCRASVPCEGSVVFMKSFLCQLCHQLPETHHICTSNSSCTPGGRQYYVANCTVPKNALCLGSRVFQKQMQCSVVSSKSWTVAFLFSLFLGGFAVDRFYLGHAGWGVFKLLSFGGVGVWTVLDVILIAVGFLGPHDKSIFPPTNVTSILHKLHTT